MKSQIDSAIAAGTQPKAPRNGLGLVLPTGARFRTLFDKNGITTAGTYYYDIVGIAPPRTFDYQQDAIRRVKVNTSHFWTGQQGMEAYCAREDFLCKGS